MGRRDKTQEQLARAEAARRAEAEAARVSEIKRQVAQFQKRLVDAQRGGNKEEALRVFKEWSATDLPMSIHIPGQVIRVLLEQDGGAEDLATAKALLEQAHTRCTKPPSEALYTLMVRLACKAGRPEEGLDYLQHFITDPDQGSAKIRTVIPILQACAKKGDVPTSERLVREYLGNMKRSCLSGKEMMMWQEVCAYRLLAAHEGISDVSQREQVVFTILHELSDVCEMLAEMEDGSGEINVGQCIKKVMEGMGWEVYEGVVGVDGQCKDTGISLRAADLTRRELSELAHLVERLAIEKASEAAVENWEQVKKWLREHPGPYHRIIDAANVGHAYQNRVDGAFSHGQIHRIALQCMREGRRPLIVLRGHWLSPRTDFTITKEKTKLSRKSFRKRKLPQLEAPDPLAQQLGEQLMDEEEEEYEECDEAEGEPIDNAPKRKRMDVDAESEQIATAPLPTPQTADQEPAAAAASAPTGEETMGDAVERETRDDDVPDTPAGMVLEQWSAANDPMSAAPFPEDLEGFKRAWEASNVLCVSPPIINDDWVAMYIAIVMGLRGVEDVQLVTNDEFRDHYFRMRHHPTLLAWQDRHSTRFRFLHDGEGPLLPTRDVVLSRPLPYTVRCQCTPDTNGWFFPSCKVDANYARVREKTQGSRDFRGDRRWIKCRRKAPDGQ